jgi:hypothetical protein
MTLEMAKAGGLVAMARGWVAHALGDKTVRTAEVRLATGTRSGDPPPRAIALRCCPETAWFELRPDWVCEVMSPSTAILDRTRKQDIYREHGVPWLWFVDPASRTVEVLKLSGRAHGQDLISRGAPASDWGTAFDSTGKRPGAPIPRLAFGPSAPRLGVVLDAQSRSTRWSSSTS